MSAAKQQQQQRVNSVEDLHEQLAIVMKALQVSNEQNAQLQERNVVLRADAERVSRRSDYMFEQQARELRRTQEELEEERMRADQFEQRLRRVEEESDEDDGDEEEESSQEDDDEEDGAETEDESGFEDEESGSEEESPERSEEEVVDRAAELDNIRAFAVGHWQEGVRVLYGRDDLEIRQVAARYDW